MLDYFAIFSKGGALLWAFQLTALRGTPVDALVRTCLLEERSGESSWTYVPPQGAGYTLKWTLHNGLGLVFVAVYQRTLKLLYIDQLLAGVKEAFTVQYKPKCFEYPGFEKRFQAILTNCEARADDKQLPQQLRPKGASGALQKGSRPKGAGAQREAGDKKSSEEDSSEDDALTTQMIRDPAASTGSMTELDAPDGSSDSPGSGSPTAAPGTSKQAGFDQGRLQKMLGSPAPRSKTNATRRKTSDTGGPKKKGAEAKPKKKEARKWGKGTASSDGETLDFSEKVEGGSGSENEQAIDLSMKSRVDADEEDDLDIIADLKEEGSAAGVGSGKPTGGLLSSFVRNISMSVTGTAALTADDISPALVGLKRKLMERNVAEDVAGKLCFSVASQLEGQKLGSFTRVSTMVAGALEEALTRILTPRRSIDILREVRAAQAQGRPYVMVFVGVNGVGKSTNLAKVTYWLLQNGLRPCIAACDTFRSGAVEQLKTHCTRLNVPLYERGYEKDPAKVAAEAIAHAKRQKYDVLLVDTAGRMQDNEPLMRALSSLINLNHPDLVLFVGEALVGNDAVDQLTKFNQRLADLARSATPHTIDGLLVTKADTVDDKVGAMISMVYVSSAPIMFIGCGQTYVDLKRLNIKSVVRSLLK
ncbi:hypothetical protein WJX84_007680 [Apatococcus fuscideae]|uniref:SRP54-type proteins GTP-binding domain-containing protein n=1 Tax=Apatococcus fuscideae TaxID=2026836 RepID=A0AAW1SBH6_9CHLO